jgi:tetratricopeptide (TPR) repeat protein
MAENNPETCPVCGHELAPGKTCDRCKQKIALRLFHRETILLLALALFSFVLYLGTRSFANSNRDVQLRLAAAWYKEGQLRLHAADPNAAVAAFRKANVNDHNNRVYVRALASALEAAGRDDEAQELLLQVRETSPEEPEVNLELARIAAKQRGFADAVRYYQNALYGIWTGDKIDAQRQQVRRELIEFLLSSQAKEQALAEIIALAGHSPGAPEAGIELGTLFLRAGDPERALDSFKQALLHDKQNSVALRGAGAAAFQLNDYAQARRFLGALVAPDPQAKAMLNMAALVLDNDPLRPRLSYAERRLRLVKDTELALSSVNQCIAKRSDAPAITQLQSLHDKLNAQRQSLSGQRTPRDSRDSDVIFMMLDLLYDAESNLSKLCGPLDDRDKALVLIAQKARRADQ